MKAYLLIEAAGGTAQRINDCLKRGVPHLSMTLEVGDEQFVGECHSVTCITALRAAEGAKPVTVGLEDDAGSKYFFTADLQAP